MTTNGQSILRARSWVLMALDSCDKAGLTPIPKTLVHRLIFLSNCLAALYQEKPPATRVIKYKRGPFYPDVQWELDRLTSMGLLGVHSLKLEEDEFGPWMTADYSISDSGIGVVSKIRETEMGGETCRYIDELVFAFVRMNSSGIEELALKDLNYSKPGIAQGAMITFDDDELNLALRKTKDFVNMAPEILRSRMREQLHLYLRYIEEGGSAA